MSDMPTVDDINLSERDWGLFDGNLGDVVRPLYEHGYRSALREIGEDLSGEGPYGETFGHLWEDLTINLPFLEGDFERQLNLPAIARDAANVYLQDGDADGIESIRRRAANLRKLADELDAIALEGLPK